MRAAMFIILISSLAGCAPKFNQYNYDRMVNIAVISRDSDSVCQNRDSMLKSFGILRREAIYAIEDSEGRSDTDVAQMMKNQLDEIDRFLDMLKKQTPSPFYCKLKTKNIYETAKIITRAEGNKLKIL